MDDEINVMSSNAKTKFHVAIETLFRAVLQDHIRRRASPPDAESDPTGESFDSLVGVLAQFRDLQNHSAMAEIQEQHSTFSEMNWTDLDDFGFQGGDIRWTPHWQRSVVKASVAYQNKVEKAAKSNGPLTRSFRTWPYNRRLAVSTLPIDMLSHALEAIRLPLALDDNSSMPEVYFEPQIIVGGPIKLATFTLHPGRDDAEAIEVTGLLGRFAMNVVHIPTSDIVDFQESDYREYLDRTSRFTAPSTSAKMGFQEAIDGDLYENLPKTIFKVAALCQVYGLTTMRACLTNAEDWLFFIYSLTEDGSHRFWVAPIIFLGGRHDDLENDSIIIALQEIWNRNPNTPMEDFYALLPEGPARDTIV